MAKKKERDVQINWSLTNNRQLEFLRACGLSWYFDHYLPGPLPPKARVILFGGAAGGGKGFQIKTEIPTINGMKTMGELVVGDIVFDENGEPTPIIETSPIMLNHPCYEFSFDCGEKIIADDEHLWVTMNDQPKIQTTGELYQTKKAAIRIGRNHIIKSIKPVESVPIKCIKVGNPSGMFLATRSMIPSHNSDAILIAALFASVAYPKCNIAIFRRNYPELEGLGGLIPRSHELYSQIAKYNGSEKKWTVYNNSIIKFNHCSQEDSVYSYQSQQFDFLFIDESTQMTEFQLRYLLTRNRATVSGVNPLCVMATNPGGVSHGYHRKYFVEAGEPGLPVDVEIQKGKFEKHLYIPSRLSDNKILEERDPGYRATLESQPDDIRRALLDGDWNIFTGQYFREFRTAKHVVEPFEIPKWWRRFGSIDWGYNAPCAAYWHAVDPTAGRVYTYRELYVTQKRAGEVAEMYKDMSGDEEIAYVKISPDAFHERGLGTKAVPGEVVGEEFTKAGINVEPADNRRVIGWQRMREYLADAPDGKPLWQIFSNCRNLIRTLPEQVYDDHRVEDISDKGEDHAVEACLTGDTLIDTTRGAIPIKDMVGKEYQVHCYDEGKMKATTANAYDIRMTQQKAKVYLIEMEDGRKVKATADHPVLTKDGWKWVCKLRDHIFDIANGMAQIKDISYCGEEDVYNMEVENYQNYSVEGGLIFHNCRYGLMSRPSPSEGDSFFPGAAEHYGTVSEDMSEDDEFQDLVEGDDYNFYGF